MKHLLTLIIALSVSQGFAQNLPEIKSRVIHWDSLVAKTENGRTRRLLAEGNTTFLKYFRIHATTIEPGKVPNAPHPNKDADELIIVKEGTIRITISGESKELTTGGIAIVLANEVHGLENIGVIPATYYVIRYQSKQPTDIARGQQGGGSLMLNKDETALKTHSKGARRDFYNRATTQCALFEMHTTALNAGLESHQQHTHAAEEIILVAKGSISELIDCQIHHAKAGDLVFLGSNVPHALINTSGSQCEYFAFTWK